MAEDLSSLSEDDLSRLLQVIESLEHSAFDFLQLEVGGLKVVLGKGSPADYADRLDQGPAGRPAASGPSAPSVPPAATLQAPAPVAPPAAPSSTPVAPPAAPVAPAPAPTDDTVEIGAPMMGIFYAQPEPGAPPFVTVGSAVQADTTVALVEVMKMFNAIPAGVEGTVAAVLAENNQLVEYGQPLFWIRPS